MTFYQYHGIGWGNVEVEMREKVSCQKSFADLEFMQQGVELEPALKSITQFLDQQGAIVERVRRDLVRGLKQPHTGRTGLTPQQVLRSLILMRVKNWDYRELRERIASDGNLAPYRGALTLLLKVMPYFVRKNKGFARSRLHDEEFHDFLGDRVDIPQSFREQADKYLDSGPLLQRLNDLERLEQKVEALHDGLISVQILGRWLHKSWEVQIVDKEIARLKKRLRDRERLHRGAKESLLHHHVYS